MKLVKKINVELNRKGFPKEIDVVQYDTGLQLECIVKDFDIPDGTIATLYAEKPSGKFVYQQTGIEISDNTIIVDLENQVITEHGKVWMQITLSNGTDTISTFEMLMKVQKSRKDSGAVESTTVIRAFDEAIEKAVAQINEARDAASKYISESVDQSLSIAGKAADAAAVGKKVTELNENLADYEETIAENYDESNYRLNQHYWQIVNLENRLLSNTETREDLLLAENGVPLVTENDVQILRTFYDLKESNFPCEKYNLPVLYLYGDTEGMSKDNEVSLQYVYGDRYGSCAVKWQGSSSIAYPKKNYTVKFDNPFEAKEGWGSQKKYCLKANWIDFSHARNVVSARLWGQIVKNRSNENTNLSGLVNGGAVDGFPISLVINGKFVGLYTFNIPKDKWLFGMGSADTQYLVTAEEHTLATQFKSVALLDGSDFAIEHKSDSVSVETVRTSLNALLYAVANCGGEEDFNNLSAYLDMDSAIDYFIFYTMLTGIDLYDKNYILASYDGIHWSFSAYDLDSTYGNHYLGTEYYKTDAFPHIWSAGNYLMNLIRQFKSEELKARYTELRNSILSEDNVLYEFSNFISSIPKGIKDEEVKVWTTIPSTESSNLTQIMNYYRLRCKFVDESIETL